MLESPKVTIYNNAYRHILKDHFSAMQQYIDSSMNHRSAGIEYMKDHKILSITKTCIIFGNAQKYRINIVHNMNHPAKIWAFDEGLKNRPDGETDYYEWWFNGTNYTKQIYNWAKENEIDITKPFDFNTLSEIKLFSCVGLL